MEPRETPLAPKQNSALRKVVVTGGLGFIGARVFRHLARLEQAGETRILDGFTRAADCRRLAPAGEAGGLPVMRGDIRSRHDVAAALQGCDTVVHLAAETGIARTSAERQRMFDVNVAGTETLLTVAREQGVKHFIHVSSSKVYGPSAGPLDETAPLKPVTPYAVSKAMAEEAVMLAAHEGLRATILRPADAVGPGQRPDQLLPGLVMNALKGQRLTIEGAGVREREFLPVGDLAAAIGRVATSEPGDETLTILNVAGEERLSALEIARRVFRAVGRTTGLHHVRDGSPAEAGCLLDDSRIRALGYRQQSSVEAELRAICDGLRARARRLHVSL